MYICTVHIYTNICVETPTNALYTHNLSIYRIIDMYIDNIYYIYIIYMLHLPIIDSLQCLSIEHGKARSAPNRFIRCWSQVISGQVPIGELMNQIGLQLVVLVGSHILQSFIEDSSAEPLRLELRSLKLP